MRRAHINTARIGRGASKWPVCSVLIVMLASFATPVRALEPQDTLRDWNAASAADRDRLLKQLEKSSEGAASRKDVVSCLNDAAGMAPHADLRVAEVFMACTNQTSEDSI
jgi:hypothetical protein